MRVADAWAELGLEPTGDRRAVKRAYAALLKRIDIDAEPAAFIRLRQAYELALQWGDRIPEWESDVGADGWDDDEPPYAAGDDAGRCGDTALTDDAIHPSESPEPLRPPLPEQGDVELDRLSSELHGLLFGPETPDPDRVAEVGQRLLDACRDAPVDAAARTEHWLLMALADSLPRSDPLIDPATVHFDWDRAVRPRDYMLGFELDTLHHRRADRGLLDRLLRGSDQDSRAAAELMKPGRTKVGLLELDLAGDVKRFLDNTLAAHPTLEHDFDRDTLEFWRGHFERWHLPSSFWWQLLTVPLVLTFTGALAYAVAQVPAPVSPLVGFAAAVGITLAVIVAVALLRAEAARRERDWRWQGYDGRGALPWLVAALAVPPTAALLPANPWTAAGCSVAALGIAIGVLLTTRAPVSQPDQGAALAPAHVSGTAILAAVTVLFSVPPLMVWQLAGPLAMTGFCAARGHDAAAVAMERAAPARARLVLIGAGLIALAAAAVMVASMPRLPPPAMLALVPAAAAGLHFATASTFMGTAGVEWGVRVAALAFYFSVGKQLYERSGDGLVAAILLYTCVYGIVRAGLALRHVGRGEAEQAYF